MGLFRKKEVIHNWDKKEVNIPELKKALEGETSIYNNSTIKKLSKKYQKYNKRDVSNLYLIREVDDEGVVCAVYAFSILSDSIPQEVLEQIKEVAKEKLSVGEMRFICSGLKPDEWWETDVEQYIKCVEQGKVDGYYDLMVAELFSKGIILTKRQVRNRRSVNELECSAVAWGVKEKGLRKGYKNRILQNNLL